MSLISMTGFGRSETDLLICEIRGVNSRYLEVNCRLPTELYFLEASIKKLAAKYATRGKLEVFIGLKNQSHCESQELITKSAKKRINNLWNEYRLLGISEKKKEEFLLRAIPLLFENKFIKHESVSAKDVPSEGLILNCIENALKTFFKTKCSEGVGITAKIGLEIKKLGKIYAEIRKVSKLFAGIQKERITKTLEKISHSGVQKSRLEQELAVLLIKSDITEEIDRLDIHLAELSKIVSNKAGGSVGKRLDVLIQELAREFTTIASKADGVKINPLTIDARVCLEKIREQIQNIE